jgi:transcriptional regulator with XRE-family HTH domain
MPRSTFSPQYERFRELLVQARKAAELTQNDLAARLKRPQSYVSKYENGERRLDLVEFLDVAAILDIDVAGFIATLQQYPQNLQQTDSNGG